MATFFAIFFLCFAHFTAAGFAFGTLFLFAFICHSNTGYHKKGSKGKLPAKQKVGSACREKRVGPYPNFAAQSTKVVTRVLAQEFEWRP